MNRLALIVVCSAFVVAVVPARADTPCKAPASSPFRLALRDKALAQLLGVSSKQVKDAIGSSKGNAADKKKALDALSALETAVGAKASAYLGQLKPAIRDWQKRMADSPLLVPFALGDVLAAAAASKPKIDPKAKEGDRKNACRTFIAGAMMDGKQQDAIHGLGHRIALDHFKSELGNYWAEKLHVLGEGLKLANDLGFSKVIAKIVEHAHAAEGVSEACEVGLEMLGEALESPALAAKAAKPVSTASASIAMWLLGSRFNELARPQLRSILEVVVQARYSVIVKQAKLPADQGGLGQYNPLGACPL
jgi:hypothetical protein